jgi:hypothetical protein
MSTLKIQIPARGKLKGSCGWVKSQLEKAEIKIDNKENFEIGIFVKLEGEKNFQCVAFKAKEEEDQHDLYRGDLWDDDLFCYLFTEEKENQYGFFGEVLTMAGKKYTDEFIKMCLAFLVEYVKNDLEEEFNLKIVKE